MFFEITLFFDSPCIYKLKTAKASKSLIIK